MLSRGLCNPPFLSLHLPFSCEKINTDKHKITVLAFPSHALLDFTLRFLGEEDTMHLAELLSLLEASRDHENNL